VARGGVCGGVCVRRTHGGGRRRMVSSHTWYITELRHAEAVLQELPPGTVEEADSSPCSEPAVTDVNMES